MSDKVFKAKQFRRALQLWANSLTDESAMMEIADVYPKWSGDSKSYKVGDIVSYGTNSYGETQLYTVLQAHVSQSNWTPDTVASLYKAVGFNDSGVSIWTKPLGATDAYDTGDIVDYNGTLYKSVIDGNVWSPDEYPAGWEVYTG